VRTIFKTQMKNPFFNLPDFGGELLDFRLALRLIMRQAFKPMLGQTRHPAPRHVVRHTMKPAFVPALKDALRNNLRVLSQKASQFPYVFPLMGDLAGGITGSLASWKLNSGSRKLSAKSQSNEATRSSTARKIHPVNEVAEKQREGVWVEYNKHAVVIARGNYANSQKVGLWREYYDTGELMIEETYLLGALHGRFSTFHPNGQCCSEGTYEYGNRHGRFFMYDESGRHVRTLSFERDALVGDVIVEESLAMA
jgi:hypothetical protein